MAVSGLAGLLLVALPAVLTPTNGPHPMSQPTRVTFVAIGLILFILGLRGAACALYTEPSGIRVVNPIAVRRYTWDQIVRFELGRWGPLPRNGVIQLADGSRAGIWAISARNPAFFKTDAKAEEMITELNGLLAQAHSHPSR